MPKLKGASGKGKGARRVGSLLTQPKNDRVKKKEKDSAKADKLRQKLAELDRISAQEYADQQQVLQN